MCHLTNRDIEARLFLNQTTISLDLSTICDSLLQLHQAIGDGVFAHLVHQLANVHRLQPAQKCPSNMSGFAVALDIAEPILLLLLHYLQPFLPVLFRDPFDNSLAILSVVIDDIANRCLVCL